MLLARTRTQQQQLKLAVFVSFIFFSSLLLGLSNPEDTFIPHKVWILNNTTSGDFCWSLSLCSPLFGSNGLSGSSLSEPGCQTQKKKKGITGFVDSEKPKLLGSNYIYLNLSLVQVR